MKLLQILFLVSILFSFSCAEVDVNQTDMSTMRNVEKEALSNLTNELSELKQDYKDAIKDTKEDYRLDIAKYALQYSLLKESIDNRKDIITYLFGIFLAVATIILFFYGAKIFEVKQSFDDKEKDYKKNLDELTSNSTRQFNDLIEKNAEKNTKKVETLIETFTKNSELKFNNFLEDKNITNEIYQRLLEDIKSNIKIEIKNELKEECDIECKEDTIKDEDIDNIMNDETIWDEGKK